jgi:hypothetical protein
MSDLEEPMQALFLWKIIIDSDTSILINTTPFILYSRCRHRCGCVIMSGMVVEVVDDVFDQGTLQLIQPTLRFRLIKGGRRQDTVSLKI